MFTKVDGTEEIVKNLKELLDQTIVFHYNCDECEDEQVTDSFDVDESFIEIFELQDGIRAFYDCTNCGNLEVKITPDLIFGIEIIE